MQLSGTVCVEIANLQLLLLIIFFLFLTLGEMFFSPLGNAFIGRVLTKPSTNYHVSLYGTRIIRNVSYMEMYMHLHSVEKFAFSKLV